VPRRRIELEAQDVAGLLRGSRLLDLRPDTPDEVRERWTQTALTAMDALCGLAEREGTDAVWDALELVSHRELLAFSTLMAAELAETDFGPGPDEPAGRDLADAELTRAVEASFADAADPRVREVMQSLVRHLHAFAAEVGLTEDDWAAGIDFLTRTGQISDDRRQEFILLSDVLGLSMLTVGINHRVPSGATESTVFGPFFVQGAPEYANGDDIANGASGQPCLIQGTIRSVAGEPVPDALIEVWQADDDGLYDVQRADLDSPQARGRLRSDAEGRYRFWSVKPEAYGIPVDGPVGELLAAGGRGTMRPAHVHFMISAPGYRTVTTHVFVEGDEHLDADAVFGVRDSLIQPFERHEPGTAPDGRELDVPFFTMDYDFVLAPEDR
jgi:hydroxyquinol 1,2-dioxygenase